MGKTVKILVSVVLLGFFADNILDRLETTMTLIENLNMKGY